MFMQDAKAFRSSEKALLALHGLNAAPDFSDGGMLAASLVETPQGWQPVGNLARGSLVQTYDGGLCAVTGVERRHLWPAAGAVLIHVPGGALDTCSDLWLMPGQAVLIAAPAVEDVLEAAAALIPARALAGFRGASLRPLVRPVEVISLCFASDEVVYVNSGAMIHCPAGGNGHASDDFFPRLDGNRAGAMLALIAGDTCRSAGLQGAA